MKLRHYTIIIALALLAASCAHEESEVAQISDVQVVISADFATPAADFAAAGVGVGVGDASSTENPAKSATKSTATAFESGDMLGLYAVKSGGELNAASNLINNHQLKVAESGAIVGDQLPAYYPDKSSSLDLFSYFPYQSGNATADALGVLVGIRTHQTDFSSLQASDLCYGRKLDAAPSAAPHPLQFRHSFAQLRLNFSLYEGCSAIATVKLLSIKDSAKLNLQTGLVTLLASSVVDVDPYVNNSLSFTAIIPAQSLSGACVEITLKDGTIYYYHATAPIALKESATNTLNLTLSDKGKLTLASTPAITAWGVESTISNISESTDNAFTFYWSPAITSFGSIDKAFVTLTNPATKKSARIEVANFVRDAISTAANAIFRFAITRTDAASIGYPVTIDKFELFNGGTAVHTLTDYYGRTVTRSGAHTFGTVTSIKLAPDGDWLNAANTTQSRAITIATTGSTSWVASASPSGIGLSVTPASGANSATATISWAAQAVGSLARSGEVTFKTTPDGITKIIATNQLAGPAPTLSLSTTSPGEIITSMGKVYTVNLVANTAWIASELTNLTVSPKSGVGNATLTITVPMTTLASNRIVSVKFTTNPLPAGVVSQTWSGTQEAFRYVNINGVKWAAEDYWGGRDALTWSEAQTVCPAGWRLPTTAEASMLMGGMGGAGPMNGVAWVNCLWGLYVSNAPWSAWLGPSAKTASPTNAIKLNHQHYWTSNQHSDINGALLAFNENNLYPAYSYPKTSYFGARCVQGASMMVVPAAPGEIVPKGGKSYTVTLLASGSWATPSLENVTVSPSSGNGGFNTVTIAVLPSNTSTTRSASVRFTSAGVSDQTWSGTQEAAPANATYINGLWWSKFNVGATTPQGYGNYYNWNTAKTACPSGWRLPTTDEFGALNNSGSAWTTLSGVNGRWFGPNAASANSATSIFFPASGHRTNGSLHYVGTYGYDWSSTELNSTNAYNLSFGSSGVDPQNYNDKTNEFSVRCVQ